MLILLKQNVENTNNESLFLFLSEKDTIWKVKPIKTYAYFGLLSKYWMVSHTELLNPVVVVLLLLLLIVEKLHVVLLVPLLLDLFRLLMWQEVVLIHRGTWKIPCWLNYALLVLKLIRKPPLHGITFLGLMMTKGMIVRLIMAEWLKIDVRLWGYQGRYGCHVVSARWHGGLGPEAGIGWTVRSRSGQLLESSWIWWSGGYQIAEGTCNRFIERWEEWTQRFCQSSWSGVGDFDGFDFYGVLGRSLGLVQNVERLRLSKLVAWLKWKRLIGWLKWLIWVLRERNHSGDRRDSVIGKVVLRVVMLLLMLCIQLVGWSLLWLNVVVVRWVVLE